MSTKQKNFCLFIVTIIFMTGATGAIYFQWDYFKDIYLALLIAILLCTKLLFLTFEKCYQRSLSPFVKLILTILLFGVLFKYLKPTFSGIGNDEVFLFQAAISIIYSADIRQYLQDLSK